MHRVAGLQFLEQHLGVSIDNHQEIVEVVSDASRQPPHSFHFLGLTKLLFELPPVGDVLGDDLQFFCGLFHAADGTTAQANHDHMAVLTLPLHFYAVQGSRAAVVFGQPIKFLGIKENVSPRIQFQNLFNRSVPKHRDQRRIHI